MSLKDKRVIVLGGTSGLGFAVAEAASRDGASVVVVSRNQESIDKALAALPPGTEGAAVDLSVEESIRGFFGGVGGFDHLIYTAGETLTLGELDSIETDRGRQAFNTRYWGAFAAVKYGKAHIRPGGSIVLTTGIASDRPLKGWTVAASICGAVVGLTRALAVELAPIRVNAVSPGLTKTGLWSGMSEADREGMYSHVGSMLLTGRVPEASEIAETYLYLMRSPASTGRVITADGGATLV